MKMNLNKTYKRFFLYGAGVKAENMLIAFEAMNIEIYKILVTDKNENASELRGIPVVQFDEVKFIPESDLIVIGVSDKFKQEIIDVIKQENDIDYCEINSFWKYARNYIFIDRRKKMDKVCFVLAGYKEYLWDKVFARLQKFAPADVEICILSSGKYSKELDNIARDHDWSYLYTTVNNVSLIQNIAISIYDHTSWIYKMDEDIFITQNSFQHLFDVWQMVEDTSYYRAGFVAPIIPVNGYGYIRVLEQTGKVNTYKKLFQTPKYAVGWKNKILGDPATAKFMWGATGDIPKLDQLNDMVKNDNGYSICNIRFSIGFILFSRFLWSSMDGFHIIHGDCMGVDEEDLCKKCMMSGKSIVIANNSVVGHLAYGPQNKEMKEFFEKNPGYF